MLEFFKAKREKTPLTQGTIRRHYRFFGRVQCVGFRYRAKYAAENQKVTGWVLNLSDGSVEMEAQGLPEQLNQVIWELQHTRSIQIKDMQVEDIPVVQDEQHFRVKADVYL